jgi:predicted small integral membrane protein
MKIMMVIFFMLISFNAYSVKRAISGSRQQIINGDTVSSDTIFIGRVLGIKVIEDAFVTSRASKYGWPAIILKVEVLKVYRGKLVKGEQRLVCTWFDPIEFEDGFYIPTGKENTFFGVDIGPSIQLPDFSPSTKDTGLDKELAKALKLPIYPNYKDPNVLFPWASPKDKLIRNVCNEPDAWEKAHAVR